MSHWCIYNLVFHVKELSDQSLLSFILKFISSPRLHLQVMIHYWRQQFDSIYLGQVWTNWLLLPDIDITGNTIESYNVCSPGSPSKSYI